MSRAAAGLDRLEGGALVPVAAAPPNPDPARRATLRVFSARSSRDGALLLTNLGPMRWSGREAPLLPLSVATATEFGREAATSAVFLPDDRLAFSSPNRDLTLLDPKGTIFQSVDTGAGGRIERLAVEDQGGLWLARLNGLTRLQLDSPFARHGAFTTTRTVFRHGSRLNLTHYEGIAWRDDATGNFHPLPGVAAGPNSLLSVGRRLFGTGQFVSEITDDDRSLLVLPVALNTLIPLRHAPGWFVGAGVAGLRRLHFDGARWRDDGLVNAVQGGVRGALEDEQGFVWTTGSGGGSWRVDFRGGTRSDAPAELFDAARGLPAARGPDSPFFLFDGGPLTARAGLLLRYDRAAARFVAEERVDGLPTTNAVGIAPGADADQWWFLGWPTQDVVRVARAAAGRWRAELLPMGPLKNLMPVSHYYDARTESLWSCAQGSLVSIDPAWRAAQPPAPLRARVRRLTTSAGELLWADAGSASLNAPPSTLAASAALSSAVPLSPAQNSLRFAFAAPAFSPDHRGAPRLVYRARLAGLEENWTAWSPTPWREFTQLPYRAFVFHVQARDLDARENAVGTLAFAIAPPWWRTRAAFAGYAVLTLLALAGFFRLRTRALLRRNSQLEALVTARTAELERLRRLEMDEKISARLAEEKARLEVLRDQLNPHFLVQARNSIYTLVWSTRGPPAISCAGSRSFAA
jgi:hypothetical protein